MKVYRNEKNVQGAKLIPTDSNNVLYHKTDVIHSWLYLTGKLQEKDGGDNRERNVVNHSGNDVEEAYKILANYVRKENNSMVEENKVNDLLRKFGGKIRDIIQKLVDGNKIVETGGNYEII